MVSMNSPTDLESAAPIAADFAKSTKSGAVRLVIQLVGNLAEECRDLCGVARLWLLAAV